MLSDELVERLAAEMIRRRLLDRQHYLAQRQGMADASDEELAQDYIRFGEAEGLSPSGHFNPAFYRCTNHDLQHATSLILHFVENGQLEGRSGSLATQLIEHDLDRLAQSEGLIPPVSVGADDPRYLTQLDLSLQTCNDTLEYFSNTFYRERHPDLSTSNVAPIFHYLKYGFSEGRAVNTKIAAFNSSLYDPDRSCVLIGVHEASRTGAPIVGLDLARSLAQSMNIIFVSMKDGPILKEARDLFPVVAVAAGYSDTEQNYLVNYLNKNFRFDKAIFSSVVCEPLMSKIAALDCHITCLVHEFLEYTNYFRNVAFESDLLVFSSKELLKSWSPILDDVLRPPESILVLPQPASASGSRQMPKAEARQEVERATGLDLKDTTLVLGAGQVQMRKGTDIFIQVANQLAHEDEPYVCVWIGEQVSQFELHYGVYLHAQIERSKDEEGKLAVHFEPAGPLYQILMDAADVFLVTSRLDPLPNVALDAAARNLPVISFRRATGLSDLAEAGQINLTEVGYAAVDEVIAAIKSNVGGRRAEATAE